MKKKIEKKEGKWTSMNKENKQIGKKKKLKHYSIELNSKTRREEKRNKK